MIEIIAVIFLSRINGLLAEAKGLKFWPWVGYTFLSWIAFEFAGVLMGLILFGMQNLIPIYLLAIGSGVLGYFFVNSILKKKPDIPTKEDTDKIGVSDLYPPKRQN